MPQPWSVPPLWSGETAFLIASGASLTRAQVEAVKSRGRVLVVNDNYLLPPPDGVALADYWPLHAEVNRFADLLYFCDERWWRWHTGRPHFAEKFASFAGTKVTLSANAATADPAIKFVENTGWNPDQGITGLDNRPTHVINGRNSGYQALHLAVHLGAKRIVLLGYDMKGGDHWFGPHVGEGGEPRQPTDKTVLARWRENFETLLGPLAERGIEVLNATPRSALECFPRINLADCP